MVDNVDSGLRPSRIFASARVRRQRRCMHVVTCRWCGASATGHVNCTSMIQVPLKSFVAGLICCAYQEQRYDSGSPVASRLERPPDIRKWRGCSRHDEFDRSVRYPKEAEDLVVCRPASLRPAYCCLQVQAMWFSDRQHCMRTESAPRRSMRKGTMPEAEDPSLHSSGIYNSYNEST